ncbi:threonine aldolase family protein [Candidatus Paracaedibacter symbiosus]|uniref:threonine aldolase family protein n=1 Tax=Candidatus Paracaedibacter symbiosus TaxID=244582 RepID=UPI000509692C|nr:low specificity L-threonine aldolase [Candidatus Paracaedibacter symbiosus]
MAFKSDNTSGISAEVLANISSVNSDIADAYGSDAVTERVCAQFNTLFEKEVSVHFMATGTAANCLALSALTPSHGVIFCGNHAHITTDEANAPELFTGGAKLINLPGSHGKICPTAFNRAIHNLRAMRPHAAMPAALSLTQSTELGTVYTRAELKTLISIAKRHDLYVHMDGARFANALVKLGESPANLTWRLGVDVLSFGGTKNGALAAEAVVFFNPDLAKNMDYQQKRFGQLMSKMHFFSCQFEALFENDLWLKNARHANTMAQQLSQTLQNFGQVEILYPVEANEIFARMPVALARTLRDQGFQFYDWSFDEHETYKVYRFVTSFNSKQSDIEKVYSLRST